MNSYKGIIAYVNGNIEEVLICADTYISAWKKLHSILNERINLGHLKVRQSILTEISC